jgi:hypothetical protein
MGWVLEFGDLGFGQKKLRKCQFGMVLKSTISTPLLQQQN